MAGSSVKRARRLTCSESCVGSTDRSAALQVPGHYASSRPLPTRVATAWSVLKMATCLAKAVIRIVPLTSITRWETVVAVPQVRW